MKVLEMMSRIPDNIGWMMVGIAVTLLAVALVKLGAVVVDAIKSRLEDEEECEG